MKRIFTILTVVALTTTISFSQAQFGAVAGLNISAIGTDATLVLGEEMGGRTGMHLGGVAHIPLGDAMQLRTGLIYSQKGGSYTFVDNTYKTTIDMNLNYLEIPIEAAFLIGEMVALSAGPYLAFAMSKTSSIETNEPDAAEMIALGQAIYDNELENSVTGVDFGLNFGASITIAENFLIGTKYSMGLSNILDVQPTSIFYTTDPLTKSYFPGETWVNGCFSISFAYMFGN